MTECLRARPAAPAATASLSCIWLAWPARRGTACCGDTLPVKLMLALPADRKVGRGSASGLAGAALGRPVGVSLRPPWSGARGGAWCAPFIPKAEGSAALRSLALRFPLAGRVTRGTAPLCLSVCSGAFGGGRGPPGRLSAAVFPAGGPAAAWPVGPRTASSPLSELTIIGELGDPRPRTMVWQWELEGTCRGTGVRFHYAEIDLYYLLAGGWG